MKTELTMVVEQAWLELNPDARSTQLEAYRGLAAMAGSTTSAER